MTLKDPEGGLTAAGRKAYARKTGAKLRPGVKGRALLRRYEATQEE